MVGSDYMSYIHIYETGDKIDKFFSDYEFIFVFMVLFLKSFDANAQFIFVGISFLNMLLLYFFMRKCSKIGMRVWLIFLLFYVVTGIYHNQMNGLRQYLAIFSMPLIVFYLMEHKKVKSIFFILYGAFSHQSFLLFLPYLLICKFKMLYKYSFIIFVITFFFYKYIIPISITEVLSYSAVYTSYLERSEETSLLSLLTKIYYLPLIMYFYYLYTFKKRIKINNDIQKSFILIFSSTYWMFLMAEEINILGRMSQYSNYFFIFPIYFLLNYLISIKRNIEVFFILLYLILPYLLKVTVFAKSEYLYNWIL
ncbi:EpsG family protein [Moritella sp. 36]|uniref:EpsG family protein n=1 Tax=Moritella sp. 36 TaxID=2746233 RepID=UPI00406C0ADF